MEESVRTENAQEQSREVQNETSAKEEIETQSLLLEIGETFSLSAVDVRTFSPLALAFLGDSVYALVIRTIVMEKGNRQAGKLHDESSALVNARAQARVADALQGLLSKEEERVYRRGHNAGPDHHAKNATWEEYIKATGLEALCGYLYLKNDTRRLLALLREGLSRCGLWQE